MLLRTVFNTKNVPQHAFTMTMETQMLTLFFLVLGGHTYTHFKMPQQDIVKIAIQMPGAYPQLIQLDQKKPLSAVIKEVCDGWNLPGPDNYALQYADGVQTYITESNRLDIKNGCILRLTKAPGRCAEDLYKGIQSSDSGVRCDSLKQLACVSTDVTFAQEFISRDGHSLLVKIVEDADESVPFSVSL
ncbi:unnamed protein product [Oncorhynchus mykiss]|uniref:Uncharacterized protein n=1 Tax=Oncorhynchus mykiss TaxID=8022 RepID=A0A060YDY5_ONCMY|nr:unnamed protein product [Oncorhynchus mykiss]